MSVELITQLERYGERFEETIDALESEGTVGPIAIEEGAAVVSAAGPRRRAWLVATAAFAVTLAAIGGVVLLTATDEPASLPPAGEPGAVVMYGASKGIGIGCAAAFAVGDDGLWTAGPCGLLRLEGESWTLETELPDDVGVYGLVAAPDGGVWVETASGGIVHYDGKSVTQYDVVAPFIAVSADGTVWARPMDFDPPQQLLRLEGEEWIRDLDAGAAGEVVIGGDGAVWVSADEDLDSSEIRTRHYVLRRLDGTWTTYPVPEDIEPGWLKPTPSGVALGIGAIFDGTDWIRIEAPPIPSLDAFGIEAIEEEEGPIDSWEWTDEVIAPNGDLWATSWFYGAVRYDGTTWRHYSTSDGLASDRLTFVAVGPDGSVWLGSSDAGLSRILPDG